MKKYFYDYDFYNMKSSKNFHLVEKFQPIQQQNDNTCGPVSVKMILQYYGQQVELSEEELVKIFKTRPYPHGTRLKDLINGTRKICDNEILSSLDMKRGKERKIFQEYQAFKEFALTYLDKNVPILVENVDCGGHYRVLIGWDEDEKNSSKDVLIFADPYDIYDGVNDGYNYFPAERFFDMWFDKNCLEKSAQVQPFVIILPKNS